jgi:hypothetical protein
MQIVSADFEFSVLLAECARLAAAMHDAVRERVLFQGELPPQLRTVEARVDALATGGAE